MRPLRAFGRALVWVVVPRPFREGTRLALHTTLTPLVRLILGIVLVAVVAGTLLSVHAAGHPLRGLAREGLLLLAALLILTLSGALAPQVRLLLRWVQREGLRRDGPWRRAGTWQGAAFRAVARVVESAPAPSAPAPSAPAPSAPAPSAPAPSAPAPPERHQDNEKGKEQAHDQ